MNKPTRSFVTHMYMSNEPGEPTDKQLDYFDDEYHRIVKKKSKLSASERRRVVNIWDKYRVRLGYGQDYAQKLREKYKQEGAKQ